MTKSKASPLKYERGQRKKYTQAISRLYSIIEVVFLDTLTNQHKTDTLKCWIRWNPILFECCETLSKENIENCNRKYPAVVIKIKFTNLFEERIITTHPRTKSRRNINYKIVEFCGISLVE